MDGNEGFELLARSLPDALLIVDPDGTVAHASVDSVDLFGMGADEIQGRPFLDAVHPDDRAAVPVSFSSGTVGAWDFRPAGADHWLNAALLSPHFDGFRSQPIGRALGDAVLVLVRRVDTGVVNDRTDLLRRAMDATNNIVVITDPHLEDNPIVIANDNFFKVTGYDRDEVIGHNCRFLQRRPDGTRDDDQEGVHELVRAVAAGERTHVLLRNYKKDGTLFYNELFVTPVLDEDGEIVSFIGVQNDVTDRITAERKAVSRPGLLGAFFDSAPVLMGVVQRDGAGIVHRTANARAREIYDLEDVAGTRPRELGFTDLEAAKWNDAVERCAETGEPVHFDTVFP
ncbi:PAS domain-containing protein, partial [Rubrivirga sp.]|uniref:PAS domain-containing protein n=1 Tax=Rubrivirga sp. TaxID=1885344 RepID=UPI003C72C5E3